MPFVALSKARWGQFTRTQSEARHYALAHLLGGTPAEFAEGGRRWMVSADDRFRPEDARVLSLLTKNRAAIKANWAPKRRKVHDEDGREVDGDVDREATAAEIADLVKDPVELPELGEDEDPFGRWDHVHFRAFTSMPDGWVAVSDE